MAPRQPLVLTSLRDEGERIVLTDETSAQDRFSEIMGMTDALQAARRTPGIWVLVGGETLNDLETDSPVAALAQLRHRSSQTRLSARRLGLDDDGLVALFGLQDRVDQGPLRIRIGI